ncbi:MAG TPA: kynureninase [Bacillales bacterium]|nr:kynureninase [Bacillales bacterium]
MDTSLKRAEQLDRTDPLAPYKKEFYVPENTIYMDGNSLGLLSVRAERAVAEAMESWKSHAIDGWLKGDHPWFHFSETVAERTAPLIGAESGEVIVASSTTVNLHQLVATFFRPQGKRTKILADALNFPSDIYALQSQLELNGLAPEEHLLRVKSRDGRFIHEEDIIAEMNEEVALVVLPSVLYRSGQLLDIPRLTAAAHERNILIGIDACHSIGAVPHHFHDDEVDFAVWCNYKYLNSGPGGTAGLFVHEKHHDRRPALTGWFGSDKEKQFDMEHTFTPAPGAGAYQLGTPHILSTAPLLGSLEMFHEAGIDAVRKKSLALTRYMMDLFETEIEDESFAIGNPRIDERRGGHVCLEHPEAASICKALKANGIVPDFRAPDVIRLAPAALYTSFVDVWQTIRTLKKIMRNSEQRSFANVRDPIA